MNVTGESVLLFLKESNAIEDVWDQGSLLKAKKSWNFLVNEDELTIPVILETHRILMKGHLKEPGKFRLVDVRVRGYIAPHYDVVPAQMSDWVSQVKTADKTAILALHVQYESIHPFIDGNGRTGRMFLNWMNLKHGLPLLIIYENQKQDYYKWFQGERKV